MTPKTITIKSFKHDGRLHIEWQAIEIERTPEHIVVLAPRGRLLHHHSRGKQFIMPWDAIEYFAIGGWHTVSREMDESGLFIKGYCNICTDLHLVDDEIHYLDLDLDLIASRDGRWHIVDQEELEEHAVLYNYPQDLVARIQREAQELQSRLNSPNTAFHERFRHWAHAGRRLLLQPELVNET